MSDESQKTELPESSQKAPVKKGRGPGRKFVKGQVTNPGGRPKDADWRAKNRHAAEVLLGELLKLAVAGKLTVAELQSALADTATRGGYLTDEKQADLFALQSRTLAQVLAGENLTEAQRTKIIDDFLAKLRQPDSDKA
jgi:hypothetical protein